MTAQSLHPAPRWNAIAIEQVRAVALALRKESVVFLSLLALTGALFVRAAIASVGTGRSYVRLDVSSSQAIPVVLMALFIPLSVWRAEDPARRTYHWAMPLSRMRHTLTRIAAGLIWVMAAVAVFMVFSELLAFVLRRISGNHALYTAAPWELLAPFTAAAFAYTLGSALVVGVRNPSRWLLGVVPTVLAMYGFSGPLGMTWLRDALLTVWQGEYGLAVALGLLIVDANASFARWGIATLLWVAGALCAVLMAAGRHVEPD